MTNISYDYIRGLVQGTGTFTFTTSSNLGSLKPRRIPSFQLRMPAEDEELLKAIRNKLKLKNKIYIYHYPGKDKAKRRPVAILIIRELGSLKNIIIPLFYDRLIGARAEQFSEWLERIETDPFVPESYKLLYRLHKSGYFRKELCRGGLFKKFIV
ncbi:MAG: hypothetical protein Q8P66_02400 [Candidatus Colwellbacteria bacterium]|nr:hypothetical protein [Candidatus Colwellbacteria bacterium]